MDYHIGINNSAYRKARKLIQSPNLFLHDLIANFSIRSSSKSLRPKKTKIKIETGNFYYTVISSVYNTENYLDRFFKSLTSQTLDFKNNIEIILIDDGSLDRSSNVINKWRLRFPDNIRYIKKINGGQASARNVGIEYATGSWITFIDPDDYVGYDYFLNLDRFINSQNDLQLVSCNIIIYKESSRIYINSHPLKHKYSNGNVVINLDSLIDDIQLSASSAFFKRETLVKFGLRFDERVRPLFEDAHFVTKYISLLNDGSIGFNSESVYYYRKRSDRSSSLDTSWINPSTFNEVLEYGCLDLLRSSKANNKSNHKYSQNVVLYHLSWYFKKIYSNPKSIDFLPEIDKLQFVSLLKNIFNYIDTSVIMELGLDGFTFFYKVGVIGLFKKKDPECQVVYLDEVDAYKQQMKFKFYFSNKDQTDIFLDGKKINHIHPKTRPHYFLGKIFCYEKIFWISTPNFSKLLHIKIDDTPTIISANSEEYRNGLPLESIIKKMKKVRTSYHNPIRSENIISWLTGHQIIASRFNNAWLLIDRDTQADDNAEHLYRYITREHSQINCFFLLRKGSHDWERLKNKGFNLVAFGSFRHWLALQNCKHLISSHADEYITNYLSTNPNRSRSFHFTFLQHGVTQHDLSNWLNKKDIALFITCTKNEYRSICGPKTNYKFTSKEVKLTGFPRHDALLNHTPSKKEKIILIMPTWRSGIDGTSSNRTSRRKFNSNFQHSKFVKNWMTLLTSKKLEKICSKYNYKILFSPHLNLQKYENIFSLPSHVEFLNHHGNSIQKLFLSSSILITDYSSVAFDFALLRRPVIYYQFDSNDIFKGIHTVNKGYFDYDRDGFGPVCVSFNEVIYEIEHSLMRNTSIENKYLEIIKNTFVFRNDRSCERVFNEILNIEKPIGINNKPTQDLAEPKYIQ